MTRPNVVSGEVDGKITQKKWCFDLTRFQTRYKVFLVRSRSVRGGEVAGSYRPRSRRMSVCASRTYGEDWGTRKSRQVGRGARTASVRLNLNESESFKFYNVSPDDDDDDHFVLRSENCLLASGQASLP